MISLTPDERRRLIDLLLQLPNMNDAEARRQLLAGLPTGLRNNVSGSAVPATHIAGIVDAAVDWGTVDAGSEALWMVLDNAIYPVRGSRVARELQTLLDTLKARTLAAPAGSPAADPPAAGAAHSATSGGVVVSGQAGNVQTGTGTQYNAGNIQSTGNSYVGSPVTQNYYYANAPGGGGVGSSSPPAGETPAPALAAPQGGPRPNVKLDRAGRKTLYAALLAAYPTMPALTFMVKFNLDQNLAVIAGGGNVGEAVFNLMQWAEARGRLSDLIVAAAEDQPTNADLQAIARQYGLAAP